MIIVMIMGYRAPAWAAELIMFESEGCTWCEAWDREIAPVYPKTAEARIAPLRRADIDDELPPDLAALKPVIYTPTFVLLHEGKEVGRILGYPGEDFFWALLEELIGKLPEQEGEQLSLKQAPAGNAICRAGGGAKRGGKEIGSC